MSPVETHRSTTQCFTANKHSSRYLQSASAHTMQGFFPPSSSVTLLRLLFEAASLISFPTCSIETQRRHGLLPSKVLTQRVKCDAEKGRRACWVAAAGGSQG